MILSLSHKYRSLFTILLWLSLSLAVTACDKNSDSPPAPAAKKEAITLSANNINAFTLKFNQNYMAQLNSLTKAYDKAKASGDSFDFIQYRNHKWTPAYIQQKDHYAAIYTHNEKYLATSPIKPLFEAFENLIYIGIALKNGLLDNNQALVDETFITIEKDKKSVADVLTSMGLKTKE